MKCRITVFFLFTMFFSSYAGLLPKPEKGKNKKIIIEIKFSPLYRKIIAGIDNDSIEFRTFRPDGIEMNPQWSVTKERIVNNRVKWTIYTDESLFVSSPFWNKLTKFLNPGDSIFLNYTENGKFLSGKGAEMFKLQDQIEKILLDRSEAPIDGWFHIKSLNDYLELQKFYNNQLKKLMPLIDSFKTRMPYHLYKYIKLLTVYNIEIDRGESFMELNNVAHKTGDLKSSDLVSICDSTLNGPWANWLRSNADNFTNTWYFYQYNRIQVWKKFGFDLTHDSLNTDAKRRTVYYRTLKQNYKGLLRERLLQYLIADEVIKELGYNHSLTQVVLKDYYKQPGFLEYKSWMKKYEVKAKRLYNYDNNGDNQTAPEFQLFDSDGNSFTRADLEGKIAVLDFWFTGCKGCIQMTPVLKKVEEAFKNDTNLIFVSVSVDGDKTQWMNSIKQRKYTTGSAYNVYTGGRGINDPILMDYDISSYPTLCLINSLGEIQFKVPDPRKDSGIALINLLQKMRSEMVDGPYILYNKDTPLKVQVKFVNRKARGTYDGKNFTFEVATDEYPKTFSVLKKKKIQIEASEFDKPEKQMVISDIEGNFDAFRKLLLNNRVIDSQYNWIYGKGHLILIGDVFDRGNQVTECLWLIYTLEDQAKQNGGYVHFILGNHEILNLSNDLRYVRKKYLQSAKILEVSYSTFVDEFSELGRWLRSKNIIEKIGNILYVHGGISREVNNLPLSLKEINDWARPHYAKRDEFKQNSATPELRILFNSSISPFWYRGYYKDTRQNNISIVDSTLQRFNVTHIITGHTIVADTISAYYGGKVINVDTKHAEGKSEALVIEGDKYYRVDSEGRKKHLVLSENSESIKKTQLKIE